MPYFTTVSTAKRCITLEPPIFLLQFEEAEYLFLNAIDTNACTTKGGRAEELAQNDGDGGSEAGGRWERDARYYQPFTGSFFWRLRGKDTGLGPLTDDRLQRYYRQLSDEERNMVTANMLIHSGEAMYSQGLVKESISMWKCALDMYNIDTGGLKAAGGNGSPDVFEYRGPRR